jgi:glutathione S-transferase
MRPVSGAHLLRKLRKFGQKRQAMQLYHQFFCPHSRFIRLVLAEYGIEAELLEEHEWKRRPEFLALNPAGTVPVLIDGELAVPNAGVIAEYLDESYGSQVADKRLMPTASASRVEVRRLLTWFNSKFFNEVSELIAREKIWKRYMRAEEGGGPPDSFAIRAARANITEHLRYLGWLAKTRKWLAGEKLTYADLAAAAHLSTCDYFGDVPWNEDENAKNWYARVKSRPAFRMLLAESIPGLPAVSSYANLDF